MENNNLPAKTQTAGAPQRNIILAVLVAIFVLAVAALFVINYFSVWVCQDGKWQRQGWPLIAEPQGGCSQLQLETAGKNDGLDNTAMVAIPEEKRIVFKTEGLELYSPAAGALLDSPLTIEGRATGTWFFEGSFPVKLADEGGKIFAESYASAQGEWMTEQLVSFQANLAFSDPKAFEGFLILERDNPAGLLDKSYAVAVPVKFGRGSAITDKKEFFKSQCGQAPDEKIMGDCGEDCNTANWKVFKNKKYGYTFRYPQSYILSNQCKNAECVSQEDNGDNVILSGDLSQQSWPLIEIRHYGTDAFNAPKGFSEIEWIMEKFSWTKECFPGSANIYFANKTGQMLSGFDIYFPRSPQTYSRREIYYVYDSKIFQIIMLDVDSPQARQFYDIWLSAFRVAGE